MMTRQQMFDTVVTHLRKQGCKAQIDDSEAFDGKACCYRTPDGLMCAAGCLIPDDRYTPALENKMVTHEEVRAVLNDIVLDFNLLNALQHIHDCDPVEYWENKFAHIASVSGLEYTSCS